MMLTLLEKRELGPGDLISEMVEYRREAEASMCVVAYVTLTCAGFVAACVAWAVTHSFDFFAIPFAAVGMLLVLRAPRIRDGWEAAGNVTCALMMFVVAAAIVGIL